MGRCFINYLVFDCYNTWTICLGNEVLINSVVVLGHNHEINSCYEDKGIFMENVYLKGYNTYIENC